MFGPRAAWLGSPQLLVKALKASANPISIAVSEPTGSLFFKCLPILVTRVPISEFGCVHDPWQAVPVVRRGGDYVRVDLGREILQLMGAQAVFQYEDRLVAGSGQALPPKFFEMALETAIPFR